MAQKVVTCPACADKGLIAIRYESGEPFDLAICSCRMGQLYRRGGEALVRAKRSLGAEHRVAWIEDFSDSPVTQAMHPSPNEDFLAAGKAKPRIR